MTDATSGSRFILWLLVALVTLAFAVRVFRLDGQSMWSDEGLSLYRAQQSLPVILSNVIQVGDVASQDTSPPLYFVLLAGLRAVAGESVFSLRFLSVAFGVLAVPLIYALGRVLFSPRTGLVAAALLALAPLHVYYAQEMRNYALLVALGLLSAWTLWAVFQAQGRRRLLLGAAWLLTAAALVYTHYFALFTLAFEGLALLVWLLARRADRRLAALLGVAVLVAAPLIPFGLTRLRAGPQFHFTEMPPLDILQHGLTAYGYGMVKVVAYPWPLILPFVALAALGALLWARWADRRAAILFTVAYLVIPLALFLAVSQISPIYNGPRHLLFGLPPFLLLLACGVTGLRGRWAWALAPVLVALLVQQVARLHDQVFDLAVYRDDVRVAAEYLSQHAAPEDVVVLHDALIGFTLRHYYTGAAPVVAVPPYGRGDEDAATAELADLARAHPRLWFLSDPRPRDGFPTKALPRWLDENLLGRFAASFRVLWLPLSITQYRAALPVSDSPPPDATALAQTWPNGLALRGARLRDASPSVDRPLQLTLYWTVNGRVAADPRLELRLVDEAGHVWWRGSREFYPEKPMADWPTGKVVALDVDIDLPPGLAPVPYTLQWRLAEGPERRVLAPQAGGDRDGWLTGLAVPFHRPAQPVELPEAATRTAASARFDGLDIIAFDGPKIAPRPGEVWTGSVYWRARQPTASGSQVRARLVDAVGKTVAETTVPWSAASFPTSAAQAGDVVRSDMVLAVPASVAGGEYGLDVTLLGTDGQPLKGRAGLLGWPTNWVRLGTVTVQDWPLVTDAPPVQRALDAVIGPARLVGADLSAPQLPAGETLTVALVWQVQTRADTSYKTFIHLLDGQGQLRAQVDAFPLGGMRPTDGWRPGEVLRDEYRLALPADLPAGTYPLGAGLYRPDDGARAPDSVGGVRQPPDMVELGTVEVRR